MAIVRTITSEKTIECLETIFARHGLPEVLVSDNGPNLVSEKFEAFLKENGNKHRHVTTRWAQANGEVERQNRSILKILQLAHAEGKDWRRELVRYMAVYRTTPHQTTGQTPAFLLMGRHPRTKLPELSQPTHGDEETRDRDQLMKFKSKQYADASRNAKMSEVKQGDLVLMKQDKKNKLSTTFEPQLLLCLIATIPRSFCTETQLKSSSTTLLMISSVIRRLIRRKTPLPLQLRWTQKSNQEVLISRKIHQGVICRGFANHWTD